MTVKKKDAREGHRRRLRDKYLAHGLEKLTDEEVLELLLSFGTPRRDCKETARAMLKNFGTIRDVFEADSELISQIPGAGPANIVAIKFIHDVAGKYLEQRLLGKIYLSSSAQVLEFLRHDLENKDKEIFKVIYLDSNNVIICVENISYGSLTGAYVYSREILERAFILRSTALVFVHNHPSGNIKPSDADLRLTRRLVHLAYLAEMKVVDHLIVGRGGFFFSFKDENLIQVYENEVRNTYYLPPRATGGLLHEKIQAKYTRIKLKVKTPKSRPTTHTEAVAEDPSPEDY